MVQSHISGQTQSSEFIKRNAELSVFTISLFRSLLVSETQRITKVCNEWEEKLVANAHLISEEIQVETFAVVFSFYVEAQPGESYIVHILNFTLSLQGSIRSTVGQGRLVMAERFTQVTFISLSLYVFAFLYLIHMSAVHRPCGQLRVRHGRKRNYHHGPDWVLGDDIHSGADHFTRIIKSSLSTMLEDLYPSSLP